MTRLGLCTHVCKPRQLIFNSFQPSSQCQVFNFSPLTRPVFSLLFEVVDKSLKVTDRAMHDTCGVGEGGLQQGGVLQKSGGSRGQGRGGCTLGTERLNENAEHLGRDWSGARGGTSLLIGGLGGLCDRESVAEEWLIQRAGKRGTHTRHRTPKGGLEHLGREW